VVKEKVMVVKRLLMRVEVLKMNLKILKIQKKMNPLVEPHKKVEKVVVNLVLMGELMP